MINESDTHEEEAWFKEKLALKCIDALQRNNIPGHYVPDKSKALTQIMSMIPSEATVGGADSVTLFQIGVTAELEKRGSNQIFNPFRKDAKDSVPATTR